MATYHVANQSQLNSAISKAKGGDSILLESGNYANIQLNAKFASSVTIASVDKTKPAVIGSLNIDGAANVKLSGLKFDHTGKTGQPFRVEDASKISISDSIFDGHTDGDGFGTGAGLMVMRSSGIVVENSRSFNFTNGFTFSNVDDLVMRNNDVSQMSADGARFAGVTNVRIVGNNFHDQNSPSWLKHKDAIQFWTSDREGPSKNVVISGNNFSNAEVAQTIYMGNALARTDATKAYRDFLIEDNVIKGGHIHGIVIEHVNGVVIRDNLLERAPGVADRPLYTPIISVGDKSVNVTITGNEVPSVQSPANATWKVFGNRITEEGNYLHWPGDAASGSFDRSPSELYQSWIKDAGPLPFNGVYRGTSGNDVFAAPDGVKSTLHGETGDDTLTGANLADVLHGGAGKDTLNGQAGDDFLFGDEGSDVLIGGDGGDMMRGGVGDDTYFVAQSGDQVIENAGEGVDLVNSSITHVLTAHVENLILIGNGDVDGAGNELANVLQGGAGDNVLSGGLGNDTLIGNAGNDTLIGGVGTDVLNGGVGADVFVFRSAGGAGLGATRDVIQAFQSGIDEIDLAGIDANSARSGDQAFRFIGSNALSGNAGDLRYGDGMVTGDVNGDGRADFMIEVASSTALSQSDFML
jgi:Ca2+-binding RTX toxin-like protein